MTTGNEETAEAERTIDEAGVTAARNETPGLSADQLERIQRNRLKARAIRQSRLHSQPYTLTNRQLNTGWQRQHYGTPVYLYVLVQWVCV